MIYLLIWGVVLLASVSAVGALVWALQHRQLEQLEKAANVIFDDEDGPPDVQAEPDHFPKP